MIEALRKIINHFDALIAEVRMSEEEVAVELMSEQDFDEAMMLAYQAGKIDASGSFDKILSAVKANLGLFQEKAAKK